MMASYIHLATNDLVRWPVMDTSKSGKRLATFGAFQVSMSIVFYYHVDIALYECPSTFFLVDVEKFLAFRTMNPDHVCIYHDAS